MDHPKFQMINFEIVLLQKKLSKQRRQIGHTGRTHGPPDKYDFRTHGFKNPALRAGHQQKFDYSQSHVEEREDTGGTDCNDNLIKTT